MQEVGEEDPGNVADSSDSIYFQDGMWCIRLSVLTTLVYRIIPMPDEIIQPIHEYYDVIPTTYAFMVSYRSTYFVSFHCGTVDDIIRTQLYHSPFFFLGNFCNPKCTLTGGQDCVLKNFI